MAKFDLLEHFLREIGRPIGNFLHSLLYHPADTTIEAITNASEWVQDHPYTCVAVVGLGMYAHHRGWLRFQDKGVHVNLDAKCCIGEAHIHNSFRIGRK